jgi:glycosyltransferase involved in cell wall biosynthesis
MACGCPVIVSREASLKEICGDAALYCDARDPLDLAGRIEELVASPDMQQLLRSKGLQRSSHFSWRECAMQHLKEIKELTVDVAGKGLGL